MRARKAGQHRNRDARADSPPTIIEPTDSPATTKRDHNAGHNGMGHGLTGQRQDVSDTRNAPTGATEKLKNHGGRQGPHHEIIVPATQT